MLSIAGRLIRTSSEDSCVRRLQVPLVASRAGLFAEVLVCELWFSGESRVIFCVEIWFHLQSRMIVNKIYSWSAVECLASITCQIWPVASIFASCILHQFGIRLARCSRTHLPNSFPALLTGYFRNKASLNNGTLLSIRYRATFFGDEQSSLHSFILWHYVGICDPDPYVVAFPEHGIAVGAVDMDGGGEVQSSGRGRRHSRGVMLHHSEHKVSPLLVGLS